VIRPQLSAHQCDWAFSIAVERTRLPTPFRSPGASVLALRREYSTSWYSEYQERTFSFSVERIRHLPAITDTRSSSEQP